MLLPSASHPTSEGAWDVTVYRDGTRSREARDLVAEQPLIIHVSGKPIATLMRTPGNECELAMGFLLTEGMVRSPSEIGAISFCPTGDMTGPNEVFVSLAEGCALRLSSPQHRRVLSSCGICGDDMIREAAEGITPFDPAREGPRAADIFALAGAMKQRQRLFQRTGGTHAAALATPPILDPASVVVCEDIGRHNALDKAVGSVCRTGKSPAGMLLALSGRLSFEMVAKAARIGISDVAGVSAPSELAVTLARKLNMFLAGFVREQTMTVYAGNAATEM